ncbi:MAG: hypothetical protein QG553_248 [Patescibacteria group bacterium]|nr:hypothetical protein [Patescibacteria group bacterium]
MYERIDQDPFIAPLEHVSAGAVSEFQAFADNDRFIVRVSSQIPPQDCTKNEHALEVFKTNSGLDVVPHYNVYGKTRHTDNSQVDLHEIEEDRFYRTIFHVTERITGVDFGDRHEVPNTEIPPELVETMLSGIVRSAVTAYDLFQPYSYEIRPYQFMYGHTALDPEDKIYLVDVDYSYLPSLSTDDVVDSLEHVVNFLTKYPVNHCFIPTIEETLSFLRRPVCQDLGWDLVGQLETKLLDYLATLDHTL